MNCGCGCADNRKTTTRKIIRKSATKKPVSKSTKSATKSSNNNSTKKPVGACGTGSNGCGCGPKSKQTTSMSSNKSPQINNNLQTEIEQKFEIKPSLKSVVESNNNASNKKIIKTKPKLLQNKKKTIKSKSNVNAKVKKVLKAKKTEIKAKSELRDHDSGTSSSELSSSSCSCSCSSCNDERIITGVILLEPRAVQTIKKQIYKKSGYGRKCGGNCDSSSEYSSDSSDYSSSSYTSSSSDDGCRGGRCGCGC